MAYTKTTWLDRAVQFANRYLKSGETSGGVTLTADPGTVTQAGTSINATNLNKIEQGIADAHVKADAALPAVSYTAADVLAKLLTVDGAGSTVDTDLVRGKVALPIDGSVAMIGRFILESIANTANNYSREIQFNYVDSAGAKRTNLTLSVDPAGNLIFSQLGVASNSVWHAGNNGPGRVIDFFDAPTDFNAATNAVDFTQYSVTGVTGGPYELADFTIFVDPELVTGRTVYFEAILKVSSSSGAVHVWDGVTKLASALSASAAFQRVRTAAIPVLSVSGKTLHCKFHSPPGGTIWFKKARLVII